MEVEGALHPSWPDEAAQLLGDVGEARGIAALPINVKIAPVGLGCFKRDLLVGCRILVAIELVPDPGQRRLAGPGCALGMGVQRQASHLDGRKRHLLVDTLGLPIAWYVTPADLSDPQGARRLLGGLAYFVPRLKKIWADAAYRGKELAEWCRQQGDGWELEVVEREPGARGFAVQPHRWILERSFAWLSHNRRLAKDYERMVQTSETLIEIAATRLVLRRLTGYRTQQPQHLP